MQFWRSKRTWFLLILSLGLIHSVTNTAYLNIIWEFDWNYLHGWSFKSNVWIPLTKHDGQLHAEKFLQSTSSHMRLIQIPCHQIKHMIYYISKLITIKKWISENITGIIIRICCHELYQKEYFESWNFHFSLCINQV